MGNRSAGFEDIRSDFNNILATFLWALALVLVITLQIYLIQHAESKSKEEDPARPLTDEGRRTVERVAAHLARLDISFDCVFHSGKLRAQQTAEILANSLKINERVEARAGLDPLTPVKPVAQWLSEQAQHGRKSVAIVGHLPSLEKLASLLVAGNENVEVVSFQYAGVVKLVPKPQGQGYTVRWSLAPELITA
jgi:phosphohistidine phosphatase